MKLWESKHYREIGEILDNLKDIEIDKWMDIAVIKYEEVSDICRIYTIIPKYHMILLKLLKCVDKDNRFEYKAEIHKLVNVECYPT